MQIKKWMATGLSALMAGATFAGAVIAAKDLSGFPGDFASKTASKSELDAFIVVGDSVSSADVVGAANIAARLAELQYDIKSTPGTTTSGITGLEKDGLALGATTTGATLAEGTNAFPTASALKNAHYSKLWSGTVSFNDKSYKTHEEVSASGVRMRHDLDAEKINGTEKMQIGTSNDVTFRYVFDQQVTALGDADGTKNYTKPFKIQIMGKDFQIVGVSSTKVTMLTGSIGETKKTSTSTTPVKHGDFSVSITDGKDATWASVKVTKGDTVVGEKTINQGSTETIGDVKVKIVIVRVGGTSADPTYSADIVVGGKDEGVEVEYDATADTSSSTKERFSSADSDWYITFTPGSSTAGVMATSASINVEYRPTTTQYYVAGAKLSFPSSYAELGFQGFNTDKFSTVTIKPTGAISPVNSTDQTFGATLYGLEITADGNSVGSGALSTPNWYTSMYLLFNSTFTANSKTWLPVIVGYKNSNGKVQVNDTLSLRGIEQLALNDPWRPRTWNTTTELGYALLNMTDNEESGITARAAPSFSFKVNYNGVGDATFWLRYFITSGSSSSTVLSSRLSNAEHNATITMGWENKTFLTRGTGNDALNTELLRLGGTTTSAEDKEVNATTDGSVRNAGKKSQEVVDDSGLLLQPTADNGPSDKVVVKVPSKALAVNAYFGKKGDTTASSTTYNALSPVKTAVAKLAKEVGAGSAARSKNLVLVGGPCANSLVQELVDAGKLDAGYSCAGGVVGAKWTTGTAYILLTEGYFATDKVALVVAGSSADDTRLATSVLQQYDADNVKGKLKGTGVKITGTEVATATIATA